MTPAASQTAERMAVVIAHWSTAHTQYFCWVVYVVTGLSTWKYVPLTVIRLIGALTRNQQRARQCAEILRLARRDAASIPSYLADPATVRKAHIQPQPRRGRTNGDNRAPSARSFHQRG
jgi:hypothetical protein